MAPHSARRAALLALRNWRTRKQLADSVIAAILEQSPLGSSDRGFALELFYGVLRNLSLLDFWISRLRTGSLAPELRDVVRLGLYQLLVLQVPEHAAVFETVELVAARHRGLINGILRSSTRRQQELKALARQQPLALRASHPDFLIDGWNAHFGSDATAALCEWNNQRPRLYARINTLKVNTADFFHLYKQAQPLAGLTDFVEFPEDFPRDALQAGHCYIQDPSTALACELLSVQPGETILDACAAPGGKSSLIASLMKNNGRLFACDREESRLRILEQNFTSLGVTMARVIRMEWGGSGERKDLETVGPVDRLLVDAPCSNTGVMRRRVDVRWRLNPDEFARMQGEQIAIVRSSLSFLKPGGVLVYSTCSLEPEENRDVVRILTNELPLKLEAEKECLPFREGFDGAYAARLVKTGP